METTLEIAERYADMVLPIIHDGNANKSFLVAMLRSAISEGQLITTRDVLVRMDRVYRAAGVAQDCSNGGT